MKAKVTLINNIHKNILPILQFCDNYLNNQLNLYK